MINDMPSLIYNLLPLSTNVANKNAIITINIALTENRSMFAVIGQIMEAIPKTSVEFTITEPIELPKAISECPARTALVPNVSSGKVVPIEIINNPTIIGGSAKSPESTVAYSTTNLALKNNKAMLKTKSMVVRIISFLLMPFSTSFLNNFLCCKILLA